MTKQKYSENIADHLILHFHRRAKDSEVSRRQDQGTDDAALCATVTLES